MRYENEFGNIIRANFGTMHPTVLREEVAPQHDWAGFAEDWVSVFGLPDESSIDKWSFEATVAVHLREHLPSVIGWVVATGIADELAEYWEFDEFVPALAEILLVRVMESHWNGSYCNDTVGQQSIALFDWGRVALAFVRAYESRCQQ